MGIFDRFPYSSTHEMNLDFMLGKATEIAEDMQTVTAGMAQVQAGLSAISEKTEQATQAAAQAAQSASSIEGSVTAAEEAAEEAQMHNESAQTWANNAMTYKADCQRSATEAAASSSSAAQAATAAAASEDTVAQYAQAANASAQSAANNNDSAHQYANQASASASNATLHSSNAQTAATNAQTAATNAQTAATNASASATNAAAAADRVENLVESLPEDFTELNNTVNQLSDEIIDLQNAITTQIPLTLENYQVTITTSSNKVVPGVSTAWQHAVIDIEPGNMMHVITTIYGTTYFGLLFASDDDSVIASYEKASENANKNIDVYYKVPAKATKLYINYRTNQSSTPSAEIVITNSGIKNIISNQTPMKLHLVSANCGSYDVGDDEDATYLANWHKLYNDMDFDLVSLQDSPFSGDYTQANLFGNTIVQNIDSDANPYDIHFESRYNLTDPYLLRVTNTIEYQGQTITNTLRAKFLRAILEIGNKQIALYSVHAAPGETAGIAALRAAQYADLIADSKNYDGSIMMGDFNAHASSEYAPFTTAGMRLGNCGYVGEIYTLGDSPTTQKVYPADNIITSSNILIRKFAALTDYNLNTDHYPVFAIVELVQ